MSYFSAHVKPGNSEKEIMIILLVVYDWNLDVESHGSSFAGLSRLFCFFILRFLACALNNDPDGGFANCLLLFAFWCLFGIKKLWN